MNQGFLVAGNGDHEFTVNWTDELISVETETKLRYTLARKKAGGKLLERSTHPDYQAMHKSWQLPKKASLEEYLDLIRGRIRSAGGEVLREESTSLAFSNEKGGNRMPEEGIER